MKRSMTVLFSLLLLVAASLVAAQGISVPIVAEKPPSYIPGETWKYNVSVDRKLDGVACDTGIQSGTYQVSTAKGGKLVIDSALRNLPTVYVPHQGPLPGYTWYRFPIEEGDFFTVAPAYIAEIEVEKFRVSVAVGVFDTFEHTFKYDRGAITYAFAPAAKATVAALMYCFAEDGRLAVEVVMQLVSYYVAEMV